MKTAKFPILKKFTAVVAAALSVGVVSSQAAIVTPPQAEAPGAALASSIANFGGVIQADTGAVAFSDVSSPSNFNGTLRSVVVKNAAGKLDFYYQLANNPNTAAPDPELYRLQLNSFFSPVDATLASGYEAFVINNGLSGITLGSGGPSTSTPGTKAAFSADRQVPVAGISGAFTGFAFDFGDDHFIDDTTGPFSNLQAGETGNFLLIRSSATDFKTITASAVGFGTAPGIRSFAPVPEPTTVLVGLALTSFVGCSEFGRSRRRKAVSAKA